MNVEKFFDELTHRLTSQGLTTGTLSDEHLPVLVDDVELFRINGEGTILYRSEDINTPEKDALLDRATSLSLNIKEYVSAMEDALPLKAQDLKEGYKKLAEYNDVVLAGIEMPQQYQFVCWRYTYDRKGVTLGHYYPGKYTEAKEDFAIRSGLVKEKKYFNDEKLKAIYKALDFCIHENPELSGKQEDEMKELKKQIEYVLPDISAELEAEQSAGQQMNM